MKANAFVMKVGHPINAIKVQDLFVWERKKSELDLSFEEYRGVLVSHV